MSYLNSQQLAFILDIKKEDARAKMCNAWEKENGIEKKGFFKENLAGATRNIRKKIEDPYPQAMLIEMLSRQLNLPGLEQAVIDIHNNYLKRPASRKYILHEYPEKFIKKKYDEGDKNPPFHITLPPALLSLLSNSTVKEIYEEWKKRFPVFTK